MRVPERQLRRTIRGILLSEAFGGGEEPDHNWDEKAAEEDAARIAKKMKKRPISWHKSLTLDQMLDPTYNDQWTPRTEHSSSVYKVPGLYQVWSNGRLYKHILPYDNEGFPAVQFLASLIADESVRGIEPTEKYIPPDSLEEGPRPLVMKKDVTEAVKEIAAVGTPEAQETAAEIKKIWRPGYWLNQMTFMGFQKGKSASEIGHSEHFEAALERWRGKA